MRATGRPPREHGYEVAVRWTGDTGSGTSGYRDYARDHEVRVAGRPVPLQGSADPAFRGDPGRWNPEELLVASLAQCHMLAYLALCSLRGVIVTAYEDAARGTMSESPGRGGQFTEVLLSPVVTVAEAGMTGTATALHESAHEQCFIARSVNFPVRHQPVIRVRR